MVVRCRSSSINYALSSRAINQIEASKRIAVEEVICAQVFFDAEEAARIDTENRALHDNEDETRMKAETVEHENAADAALKEAVTLAAKLGADYRDGEEMGSSRNEEYFANINIKTGSFSTMRLFCLFYDPKTTFLPAFSITGIMPVALFTPPLSDLIDIS